MNLNRSFSDAPVTLDIQRSSFMQSSNHSTTFKEGDLVPIFLQEVLPGDTFSLNQASLCRMTTPIYPVMDNAHLDCFYFYVPSRILWTHFKEFMGENTTAPWTQETEYTIPQCVVSYADSVDPGSLADYMGIPCFYNDNANRKASFSDLPFRAYELIWNEWFRDQNTQYPINIYLGDSDKTYGNGSPYAHGEELLKVCRLPDYFSTCLPAPQKGDPVLLPMAGLAPVVYSDRHNNYLVPGGAGEDQPYPFASFSDIQGNAFAPDEGQVSIGIGADGRLGVNNPYEFSLVENVVNDNAYADLSAVTAATVNQLREAFAIQRLYERDALGGSRFREILKSHFSVSLPDSRVQIPEYLGGFRVPVNMSDVVQSSESGSTPQGTVAGYSKTASNNSVFTKSFVEPGYILGLACVRVDRSYGQGLERFWSRTRRFDFYYPALANLGNVPVRKGEVFFDNSSDVDDVFGYQEAWADYRYKPNRVSGLFKPYYDPDDGEWKAGDLSAWKYTDFYDESPTLSASWMSETDSNISNTLAVPDEDQFIADFHFNVNAVRPMPMYSVPGLIDHH